MMKKRGVMRIRGTSVHQVWRLVEQTLQVAERSLNDGVYGGFETSIDSRFATSDDFLPVFESMFLGDEVARLFD
jgi:hypothetical protein